MRYKGKFVFGISAGVILTKGKKHDIFLPEPLSIDAVH